MDRPLKVGCALVNAIEAIELSLRRIAVVLSDDGALLGTLTDGDIRRCLLAGGTLQTPVESAMNRSPLIALETSPKELMLEIMKSGNVLALPLVDSLGRYSRIIHINDINVEVQGKSSTVFEFAVIMAGGEGRRLRPLTDSIPKPMVDIGGVPLLERQITTLKKCGIDKVYVAVNYLGHMIEEYLGDGKKFGLEILYLRESSKMGTAGALSLLNASPKGPILVMNGDVVTQSSLDGLGVFHLEHDAEITVGAIHYNVSVPFGVIENDGVVIKGLVEKPSQRFLCNAGIYALSPAALSLIPSNEYFDMTTLVEICLKNGLVASVFPIHEYWSDIGTPADLEAVRSLFSEKKYGN